MDGDCRFDGKVAATVLRQYHDGEPMSDAHLRILKTALEFLVGFHLECGMDPLMVYYNADLVTVKQIIEKRKNESTKTV